MFKKLTRNACQRNRAVIAGKRPVALLKQGANISKRHSLGISPVQLTAGRDGPIPDRATGVQREVGYRH